MIALDGSIIVNHLISPDLVRSDARFCVSVLTDLRLPASERIQTMMILSCYISLLCASSTHIRFVTVDISVTLHEKQIASHQVIGYD